jgi:hypothetical protein
MNRLLVALVILLFLEIDVAWACSGRIEGGIDYADLELQEALVQELAATAETIALVQVVQVDYEVPKLDVRTREVIKGTLDQRVELTWEGYDRYACKPSASFHNIRVTEGKEYLVYLENGRLRRAAELYRSPRNVSFEREINLITATVSEDATFP